jgi:hypothetical protein
MTDINGFPNDSTFSGGVFTSSLQDLGETVEVQLSENTIDLIGTNVLVNGEPIAAEVFLSSAGGESLVVEGTSLNLIIKGLNSGSDITLTNDMETVTINYDDTRLLVVEDKTQNITATINNTVITGDLNMIDYTDLDVPVTTSNVFNPLNTATDDSYGMRFTISTNINLIRVGVPFAHWTDPFSTLDVICKFWNDADSVTPVATFIIDRLTPYNNFYIFELISPLLLVAGTYRMSFGYKAGMFRNLIQFIPMVFSPIFSNVQGASTGSPDGAYPTILVVATGQELMIGGYFWYSIFEQAKLSVDTIITNVIESTNTNILYNNTIDMNGFNIINAQNINTLNEKTEHLPIAHNPFIYTDTEPINSNQNRVYLDDDLNLYSGSFGDSGYPKQADLPTIYTGTVRPVTTEAELDSAITASVDYDVILVTASFFITSSKTINKKIRIRATLPIYKITFASATQLFLITSSYVWFSGLSFNNVNTGSSANILNFSLSSGVNNFVTDCIFETNEFAIGSNNTNIQITNNTFTFVGTGDSHRYIILTGCLGTSFINDNIFQGNGASSTQCININNASPPAFLNGHLVIKNNVSAVSAVQRLLMVDINLVGSNFSLYVSNNTMTTTSGFIIFFALPFDGIKQIYLYNNTEILGPAITGSKGIIGLDSPASSVISFNTKIYSSRNTIPILRVDYTDLINPLAEQPRVIAYATSKFTPAQLYDLIIPLVNSLAGGTVDLTALETKTQNITSSAVDLTTISGNLTTDSLATASITDQLLSSSIELTTGGINLTSDALNFNSNSVLYTPYPTSIEASSFIVTGGTANQYLLANGTTLTQSANSGNSNFYLYDNSTSQSPTPDDGLITYNNAVQANATLIYISHRTHDNIDIEVFLKQISVTTDVYIQDKVVSENYIQYNITAPPTIVVDSHVTIPVILRQGAGDGLTSFSNNQDLLLAFFTNSLEVDTRISAVETKTQNIIENQTNANQTTFGGSFGITANAFIKSGGAGNQFLKANGTTDNSAYITASNAIITTLQTQNQNQTGTTTNTSFTGSGGVEAVKFVKTDGLSTQFLKANGDSDSTSYLPQVSNITRYGGLKLSTLSTLVLNGAQSNVSVIPASISGTKSFLANEAIIGSSYSIHLYGTIASNDTATLTIDFLNSTHTKTSPIIGTGGGFNFGLRIIYTVRTNVQFVITGDWLIYTPTPIFIPFRDLGGGNITTASTFDIKYTTNGTSSLVFSSSHLVLSKIG